MVDSSTNFNCIGHDVSTARVQTGHFPSHHADEVFRITVDTYSKIGKGSKHPFLFDVVEQLTSICRLSDPCPTVNPKQVLPLVRFDPLKSFLNLVLSTASKVLIMG